MVRAPGQRRQARAICAFERSGSDPTLYANGPAVWIEELMVAEPHRRGGWRLSLSSPADLCDFADLTSGPNPIRHHKGEAA